VAGVLVCAAVVYIERSLKIDDPVGAISVHGVCGLWGILSVGLLADGTLRRRAGMASTARSAGCSTAMLRSSWPTDRRRGQLRRRGDHGVHRLQGHGLVVRRHRVSAQTEELGLDVPEMGVEGYPNSTEAGTVVVLDELSVAVPAERFLGAFGAGHLMRPPVSDFVRGLLLLLPGVLAGQVKLTGFAEGRRVFQPLQW